jgi:hypothetical protein
VISSEQRKGRLGFWTVLEEANKNNIGSKQKQYNPQQIAYLEDVNVITSDSVQAQSRIRRSIINGNIIINSQ